MKYGLTHPQIKEIASELGVSTVWIYQILRGYPVSMKLAQKIKHKYGIGLDLIADGSAQDRQEALAAALAQAA